MKQKPGTRYGLRNSDWERLLYLIEPARLDLDDESRQLLTKQSPHLVIHDVIDSWYEELTSLTYMLSKWHSQALKEGKMQAGDEDDLIIADTMLDAAYQVMYLAWLKRGFV